MQMMDDMLDEVSPQEDSTDSASSDQEHPVETDKPRKRKLNKAKVVRNRKKVRYDDHQSESSCQCKQQCFNKMGDQERVDLLVQFNSLKTKDAQSSHLAGLITVLPVARRQVKKDNPRRQHSFGYCVRVVRNGAAVTFPVCQVAFRSLHGISKHDLSYITRS
eukprot:Lithocolla_globosa_v1_NODE_4548_length_1412_cov_15.497421.p2 type:complete len:162 gc:universal NODE_4548_length_1412_cov_15.497421:1341-856(-)